MGKSLLPSKALLYRDWKYSKWFMVLFFLELFFIHIPSFNFSDTSSRVIMYYTNSFFWLLCLYCTILLMCVVLFHFDRKTSVYTFTASMPFSKAEIMKSKWLVGCYNIFIPYLGIYALVNCLMIVNFCWQKYFLTVTSWFALNLLLSFFIQGFILMMLSLNGSTIIGSFLTTLFAAFPFEVLFIIKKMLDHYTVVYLPKLLEPLNLYTSLPRAYEVIFGFFGIYPDTIIIPPHIGSSCDFLQGENYLMYYKIFCMLLYIGSIGIFFRLSTRFYKNNALEYNGTIVSDGLFSKVYKFVLAYFLCFLVGTAFNAYFTTNAPQLSFRPDISMLFFVLLPIFVYFVVGKIIKLYNHRFQ